MDFLRKITVGLGVFWNREYSKKQAEPDLLYDYQQDEIYGHGIDGRVM